MAAPLLHIAVYAHSAHHGPQALPMPQAPPLFEEGVPIGLESTQSEAFSDQAVFVMVRPDIACCLAFGPDPVAEAGIHPVDARERMWYGVFPGHRIAVIEHLKG